MKTLLLALIFSCGTLLNATSNQEVKSNTANWLLGKWIVDYDQKHLALLKKHVGDQTIEWTTHEYVVPDRNKPDAFVRKKYEIVKQTPESITFKYDMKNHKATETWHKAEGGICFISPTTKNVILFLVKAEK